LRKPTAARAIQEAYNIEHNITPKSIVKQVRDLTDRVKAQITEEYIPADAKISAASLPKDSCNA